MSQQLKVPVVVENRPGANGILAHETVVRQPADGYSLVISYSAALIGNKLMLPKMSHDPLVDLQPIGRIGGGGGNVLIVNADLPVRNIKEMVDWVKARGVEVSYASWGIASGGHLVMEMMKHRLGMKLSHVPYKTVAQIPPDIISGVVPIAWIDSATPVTHVKSGRVRAIATAAQRRLPLFPEVATLNEQGIPFEVETWYGLFAPAGLPHDVLVRLNTVLNQWLRLPETASFFEQKQNSPAPIPMTPEQYIALLQRDVVAWKGLIADSRVVL
jgi:tripartite-type tricarboxylate transporter receptor subunit TctC